MIRKKKLVYKIYQTVVTADIIGDVKFNSEDLIVKIGFLF